MIIHELKYKIDNKIEKDRLFRQLPTSNLWFIKLALCKRETPYAGV